MSLSCMDGGYAVWLSPTRLLSRFTAFQESKTTRDEFTFLLHYEFWGNVAQNTCLNVDSVPPPCEQGNGFSCLNNSKYCQEFRYVVTTSAEVVEAYFALATLCFRKRYLNLFRLNATIRFQFIWHIFFANNSRFVTTDKLICESHLQFAKKNNLKILQFEDSRRLQQSLTELTERLTSLEKTRGDEIHSTKIYHVCKCNNLLKITTKHNNTTWKY